uniref:DNA internalization-related competence protein ComEC/Rec2 n=1 Tax=uncultured Acinetobacter sp. TaxID=165433 RepID=UPI00260CF614|nr:DNA internalization-related competence protein ComEC/Rec2 [uncultured Acinetobacter sp.]
MIRWLCLAWIIGIVTLGMPFEFVERYFSLFWAIPCFTSLSLLLLLWRFDRVLHWKWLNFSLKFIAFISTLMLAMSYADQRLQHRLANDVIERQTVEGIVYISQLSEGKLENWRQPAQLLIPEQNRSLKILLYPKRIYDAQGEVIGMSTDQLGLGQFYQMTLDIKPPHGYVNRGGFDQEKWLLQQAIQGTATVLYSQPITASDVQSMGWYRFVVDQRGVLNDWRLQVEKLRFEFRQQLLEQNNFSHHNDFEIARHSQEQGLLLALLTGDRSGIDQATTQRFQVLGISHLLAISGPHVLLLAAMLTWALMKTLHLSMRVGRLETLYLKFPRQLFYIPIFLSLVSFYVVFTGFEIPALRTWLIACIASICLWQRWQISTLTMLLMAAVIVLILDCFAILSAAFWLSFVASGILLLIYRQVQKHETHPEDTFVDHLKYAFSVLLQTQWRVFIALLPIVLWQFKAVSMLSPLVNLLAIPFLSLIIVPLNILSALIWQVIPIIGEPTGELLWGFSVFLLSIFHSILKAIEPIATALYLPSFFTGMSLLCIAIAVAILMLPKGLIARYWAIFFLIPIFFQQSLRAHLTVDILDVGQGQAIAVHTQKHHMLLDTGMGAWQAGQPTMGDRVIVPYLRDQGIRKLDEILLTHLDLDHRGGTDAIVREIAVKQLRSNEQEDGVTNYPDVPFIQCERGQSWQWGEVKFEVLSPISNEPIESGLLQNTNESSCVVLITSNHATDIFKILMMGDAGWLTEYQLMRDYPDLEADILVLGHHGSRHSSAYDFLKQIQPKLAVISVGIDNRYGHPTPETIARLEALNIPYVDTAQMGGVHIEQKEADSTWTWQYRRADRKWLQPNNELVLKRAGLN